MEEFINTFEVLGDEELCTRIIMRTLTEYKDNLSTIIGPFVFCDCKNLTEIDIPNVVALGDSALSGTAFETLNLPLVESMGSSCCTIASLKTLNAPNLQTIGAYCFEKSGISNLYLPKLSVIPGNNAFAYAQLVDVHLPALTKITASTTFYSCQKLTKAEFDTLTQLGGAQVFYNCTVLKSLVLRSGTVCTLGNTNSFNNTLIASGDGYVYVPRALVDSYKVATNWSTYATQFRALEDYTVDGTITGEFDETKI